MNQKHLSSHARLSLCAAAVLTLVSNVQAQSDAAAPVQQIERIQVTGSSIKRLAGETALPVSAIKSEELDARGHTELKDLVLELPQSLSLGTNSGAAGPVLNLRGLGPMRTLTLLNGRRMANEPLQDQYVSVNVIPRIALERAETLRDGASSIYGSDAIGGVQNFLTYNTYKGAKIKVEQNSPERGSHGATSGVGLIAGFGDLAADGWNVYGAFDYQTKSALFQGDRPELFDGSALNQLGLLLTPSNKDQSPIANYGFSATANSNYNSSFATGCVAPYSLQTLGAGSVAATPSYGNAGCRRDPAYFTAVTDGSQIKTLFGKATMNLGQGHRVSAELLHADFTVQKYRGMQVISNAEMPVSVTSGAYYTIPSTSKFYPGKGITPLVNVIGSNTGANSPAMFIDQSKTPGTVTSLNMANRLVYFQWGPGELGPAYRNDQQLNDRLVLSAEGSFWNWDYRVGLNYGHSTRNTRTGGGYILASKAQAGFTNGILNPFGPQDAAGLEYLKSIELRDYVYRKNEAFNKSVDFTLTRELMDLGGGPLTLAVSGELRRDDAKVSAAPTDYVSVISSAGVVTKDDIVGENPTGVAAKLHRNIKSAVVELDAPITKQWTINGAVRSDTYSDLKTTTVNPKLSVRFQPTAEVMLRASANTGFRAPSIMDIQNPTPEVRQQTMDDPVLCPSATPTQTNTGTPVAAWADKASLVCNVSTDYWTKSPDNSHLKPEKSKGWAVGGAFEPVRGLLVTVDYWSVKLTDVLGALTLAEVQQQPAKYAANILRKADGTIDHILTSQANRGDMDMRGLDIGATYQLKAGDWGTFNFKVDGTYYDKYAFSVEKGGEMLENIGILTGDGKFTGPNAGLATMQQIVYRWKHTASVNWRLGKLSTQLSQRYSSGLTDLTPRGTSTYTEVKAYKQYNLSLSYSFTKSLKMMVGINNLTNVNPPLTANTGYNGYLTSGADILGRTYRFSGEYNF